MADFSSPISFGKYIARHCFMLLRMRLDKSASSKTDGIARERLRIQQAEETKSSHSLGSTLLTQAKHLIADSGVGSMPRAPSGRSAVYLPSEIPHIVLKHTGVPTNFQRLETMIIAREICGKKGYRHLAIPKADTYGDFIIEERLPIKFFHLKEQIGFYLNHHKLLTGAIKEFAEFCFENEVCDLTGGRNPLNALSGGAPIPRFDNVPFYQVEEGGEIQFKIGLIDLEGFSSGGKDIAAEHLRTVLTTMVHLFPLHLETILEVAGKYGKETEVETFQKELILEQQTALLFFKRSYTDHRQFLSDNDIPLSMPLKFSSHLETYESLRKEGFEKYIFEHLVNGHKDEMSRLHGCLGVSVDDSLDKLGKSMPKIYEGILSILRNQIEEKLKSCKSRPVSEEEWLYCRTLIFDPKILTEPVFMLLKENLEFPDTIKGIFLAKELTEMIFKGMKERGGLAYFNYITDNQCCIFC